MTSPEYQRRERQFEIDSICARYAEEVESGRRPNVADYLARYPQYAAELSDYIVTYHLSLADLPEPDETPEPVRSPAFARALQAIHDQEAAQAAQAAPAALAGLVSRGIERGLNPRSLAERVGLSSTIIARLDARAISAASIPGELFRRLADALDVQQEAIMAYFSARPQASGGFYYADTAPTPTQDDFLTVIEASDDLAPERKAEWRQITGH